jgi:hypothetical protein
MQVCCPSNILKSATESKASNTSTASELNDSQTRAAMELNKSHVSGGQRKQSQAKAMSSYCIMPMHELQK